MAFSDFDLISQRRQEEKKQKFKQRLILAFVISVIVILLLAAAVCFAIYKTNQHNHNVAAGQHPPSPPPKPKTTQSIVKSVCATTDYKKTCEDSILKEIKNNASATPMEILRASLAATSHEIDDVIKQAKDVKFETPIQKAALNDCMVLLKDAKDELNTSISAIKGKDIEKMSSMKGELNNWLSAVISYQQTCIDGFPEGKEKEKMKRLLESIKMLGSNTLAITAEVASALSKAEESSGNSQRKLLNLDKQGYPTWMNHEHRRILKSDGGKFTPNVIVAKDNTGNFTTINGALKAMPKNFKGRYVVALHHWLFILL